MSLIRKSILSFDNEYRWLSNFWPSEFYWNQHTWSTVEHAYQAHKAHILAEFYQIKDAPSPGQAKRLGRQCHKRNDWDAVKLEIMADAVYAKFEQNVHLMRLLLETGNNHLEEGNNWGDTFWGTCNGKGENHLGKILMKTRQLMLPMASVRY